MNQSGVNIRAVSAAASLLESDLTFHSVLDTAFREGGDRMSIYYRDNTNPRSYFESHGKIEIDWYVEIEAREWGIKDITVGVTSLVLDGYVEESDAEGDMHRTDKDFHYEYPEATESREPIGPDLDAPSPANIQRLATPKWKVEWRRESTGDTIYPSAVDVDLNKHTIDITF